MQKKTCEILYDTYIGWFRCHFCGHWHYAAHWIRATYDKKDTLQCPMSKIYIFKDESSLELYYGAGHVE
jgi:hypothetical protein